VRVSRDLCIEETEGCYQKSCGCGGGGYCGLDIKEPQTSGRVSYTWLCLNINKVLVLEPSLKLFCDKEVGCHTGHGTVTVKSLIKVKIKLREFGKSSRNHKPPATARTTVSLGPNLHYHTITTLLLRHSPHHTLNTIPITRQTIEKVVFAFRRPSQCHPRLKVKNQHIP
jgi:hypothetical protein